MDIDFSTSAGQGLSTRNETFSSEWLSMTILSSLSFTPFKGKGSGVERWRKGGAYQYVHDTANKILRGSPQYV